jgi:flagella basal body P-ring formation protein FlgA
MRSLLILAALVLAGAPVSASDEDAEALVALDPPTAVDTLTLHEQAFVQGPEVRLGDVADISGLNAEVLASISLGAAPQPGESKRLQASLIEARLRRAGVDPGAVSLRGARQVEATTLWQEVGRRDLAASLRAHIAETMPWSAEDTLVEIPLPLEDLVVPEGLLELEWRPAPGYRLVGDGAFQGVLRVDGRQEKTLLVKARIEPQTDVLVTVGDVPRGRVIGPADVQVQRMPLSQAPQGALGNLDEALGQVAQRNVFPGQVLTARNVARPMLIRRNQPVAFVTRSRAVQVQGRALAVSDARAGDVLQLRALETKEVFQGVVQADGTVLVP